jgi:hypothetical protein
LLRAYRDPSFRLPSNHAGHSLIDSLAAFFSVVSRFGNEVLKADIARFSALIPEIDGLTFPEVLGQLAMARSKPD